MENNLEKKTDSGSTSFVETGKAFLMKLKAAGLTRRESDIIEAQKKLEKEKENLRVRERSIQEAEIRREQGYTDERKKLDEEIFNKRKTLEDQLNARRSGEMKEMAEQISAEEKKRRDHLESELAVIRKKIDDELNEIKNTREEMKQKNGQLEKWELELQLKEKILEEKKQGIEEEIKRRTAERERSFESDKSRIEDENERLRNELREVKDLWDNYDELKRKLGGEPEKVLLELKAYEEQMNELKNELMERPPKEMQDTIDKKNKDINALKEACTRISEENTRLKSEVHAGTMKEFEKEKYEDEIRQLKSRNDALVAEEARLEEENKRMRLRYERKEDEEDRKKEIEKPYFQDFKERAKTKTEKVNDKEVKTLVTADEKEITEIDWLDDIMDKCSKYGLKFPKRILYAYHTALKTAEWSPLTVLSGVSGTGKSELPRLYAHFGGLNFLSVSVQPNWDSQESMLGFFNSIDNRFEAQPVLRLLAQTQKESANGYHGLNDVMTLILLDEMNLAYIELYFAEFLSKLESRRGKPENSTEFIEVKIGSGLEPYKLSLGRNVLWTGTMNQDETTKSLSDKVLDRGIIINFPRPAVLERREKLKPLGENDFRESPLLPKNIWRSWRTLNSDFSNDDIGPYKRFVEDMNKSLSKVSRALGHRVWQSIEYYMANYPGIAKAMDKDKEKREELMRTAFEDQLVQKIMPKLRGIETRGKAKTDCLDEIRKQLEKEKYSIVEDFDLACEFGYGQFIWNSANYIKEEEHAPSEKTEEENSNIKG